MPSISQLLPLHSIMQLFPLAMILTLFLLIYQWLSIMRKASLAAQKINQLTDIKAPNDPSFSIEDLAMYLVARTTMGKMVADGRLNVNASALDFQGGAAVGFGVLKLLKKFQPNLCFCAIFLIVPLPFGILSTIILGAVILFLLQQAGQFQVKVREALSAPTAETRNKSKKQTAAQDSAVTMPDEIQKLHQMHQAVEFQVKVREAMSQQRRGSSIEDISRLHDLLKSGALTQEEFEAEKKKALSKVA